jgi:hypothetical protein
MRGMYAHIPRVPESSAAVTAYGATVSTAPQACVVFGRGAPPQGSSLPFFGPDRSVDPDRGSGSGR